MSHRGWGGDEVVLHFNGGWVDSIFYSQRPKQQRYTHSWALRDASPLPPLPSPPQL